MEDIALRVRAIGHVLIRDKHDGCVLVDKHNAIHIENFSEALALSIANRANGHIYEMVFGNGGSTVDAVGTITYFPPNTVGQSAQLYNQTYSKVVDDQSPLDTDTTENYLSVAHTQGALYSDVLITCALSYGEPSGQAAFDDATVTNANTSSGATDATATYIFDELGLKAYDAVSGDGRLLSHVIFHPVQKALNREIEVIYTIRIIMS